MKKFTIILLIFFFTFSSTAQESIRGKVIEKSGAAIEFATIAILSAIDSSLIQSALTNSAGDYELKSLAPDTYLIKTFLIGYEDKISSIEINEKTKNIPEIILITGSVNLDEINVDAIRKSIEYKNGNIR